MDYKFFPWGNAYYNTTACGTSGFDKNVMFCWVKECGGASPPADCFTGVKLCQHGTNECEADTLEACAIDTYPDPADYAPFVTCFEGENRAQLWAAPTCARHVGLDYAKIASCTANASRTAALDVAMAKATVALGVAKLGTPWVLLDGQYVSDTNTLLKQVCAKLEAPLPAGCTAA